MATTSKIASLAGTADRSRHLNDSREVQSINEARGIAASDMRVRMRDLERGGTPACPERYMVWAQGLEGGYIPAATIQP